MNRNKEKNSLKKDFRILFASSLLFILVNSMDHFGEWFGATVFWIIAYSVIAYCTILVLWLIIEIYDWLKTGFKKKQLLWIYLESLGILIASLYKIR